MKDGEVERGGMSGASCGDGRYWLRMRGATFCTLRTPCDSVVLQFPPCSVSWH